MEKEKIKFKEMKNNKEYQNECKLKKGKWKNTKKWKMKTKMKNKEKKEKKRKKWTNSEQKKWNKKWNKWKENDVMKNLK